MSHPKDLESTEVKYFKQHADMGQVALYYPCLNTEKHQEGRRQDKTDLTAPQCKRQFE